MTAGRLIIISEATPTKLTQLLQLRPNLKGVFEAAPIVAMPEERAAKFVEIYLQALTKESKVTFDPETGSQAMQLARQYLGTSQLPGGVLDLIKLTFNRCVGEGAKAIAPGDILLTLSQVTGLAGCDPGRERAGRARRGAAVLRRARDGSGGGGGMRSSTGLRC